jgi:glycosyltransferase involved in cell wall biosynthesis
MKILVVCQYYYPDNRSSTPICEELVRRGHEVTVLTGLPNYGFGKIAPGYEKKFFETRNGVRIFRVKLKPRTEHKASLLKNYLSFWKNSRSFIRKFNEQFDIVFSMCQSPITACDCANIYASKHAIPHIHYCLDLWPESVVAAGKIRRNSLVYKVLYKISHKIYAPMDEIIVSSPSFIDYFKQVHCFTNKKLVFIPQPSFTPNLGETLASKSKKPVIVYGGNIGTIQNVDNLIFAAIKLRKYFDFDFYLLGNGSKVTEMAKIIHDYSAGVYIHLMGQLTPAEASKYYNSATCLLVSLLDDGTFVSKTIPNKLLTYLAYGKPIVAALSGDGSNLSKFTDGIINSGTDSDSISNAICKIFSMSSSQQEELGAENSNLYQQKFSFSVLMNMIESELVLANSRCVRNKKQEDAKNE